MAKADEVLQAFDEVISDGVRRGMLHNVAEDERLDGRLVTLGGRPVVNFGSCSYLGLETHPALRAGVVDAVERYGTQFSSSRAYLSAPGYAEAEAELAALFGRPAILTPSTTMGHLAALPTVVGSDDVLLLDHQVHHSVQTAAKLVQAQGARVELVPHSDLRTVRRRIEELRRSHRRIWYALDGLYSMYADFAPFEELDALVAEHGQLWLYVDDAHAFSWTGRHGRGRALDALDPATLERSVVAGSLNKSFAAAGGAVTFPDAELRRRVFTVGGPLIFSGPVQPPMLGAVLASLRLHRTPEVAARQERLLDVIRLFNRLAAERALPVVSLSEAPIRCVGAGRPQVAYNLTGRLRDAGYFVDTATFPAVVAKRSGARIALTAHHTDEDVAGLVDALADALPRALAEEGDSVETLRRAFHRQLAGRPIGAPEQPLVQRQPLFLEHHTTITAIERGEWDAMLGGRGAFDWQGLRALEDAFGQVRDLQPEHRWRFHYWLVRDPAAGGRPVAATFFTTAVWKDDMLAAPHVSAEIERRRGADPRYLTSTMLGMGSLLSEGDHLYLDRTRDWRAALRLILAAARAEEDAAGAAGVVLRDLPDGDPELHEVLLGEGFARVPSLDTWTRPIDFADDEQFLAGLPKKARYHQRVNVLAWEDRYDVRRYPGGSPEAALLGPRERDHLYRLYRNVHARSLELNVFPLPRRLLDALLHRPGWELVALSLREAPAEGPVAFAMQHIGADHVQPLFVGLDYRYVASHHAYQQTLWQAVRSAQRHGAGRVFYGMSADLQKARFGAVREKRWVYLQSTDGYQLDVVHQLGEQLAVPAA
ncbi:aminotransferase class I/II-fold pyridoxal phosphate-dependent enzyme [Dactylosporangium sp. CA-092794]|uniref:aminotransferase class I/II-fold pyridoxal phosphate-dependent enzyme n=1 Tax=Dactylosporangium sp. CA-092794 TaxID=3239929 RepID=UPI003D8EDB56